MPSARDKLEAALTHINDPAGEGARACLTIYRDAARDAADAADERAKAGISLGALDGAIVSIKDLFDVAGEVTRAGSKILADEGKPAARDAPIVQRLRAAGSVIIAKTNMTEFAYSGVGANPHFGTPGNPADRARIPGGSSSGGAVAVADHMCERAGAAAAHHHVRRERPRPRRRGRPPGRGGLVCRFGGFKADPAARADD